MELLLKLFPMIKSLVGGLTKLLTGLFLIKHGKQKEQLKNADKEVKDARKAEKTKSALNSVDEPTIDDLL